MRSRVEVQVGCREWCQRQELSDAEVDMNLLVEDAVESSWMTEEK